MSIERRNSFRFTLSEELRGATIEARSRRLPVELLDQSNDGFSVKAPRDIEIALDELVWIETWAGRCQAVVARLSDCRDSRRIGLQRVSDMTICSRHSRWLGGWFRDRMPRPKDSRSRKAAAWGAASLAGAMLLAAGWMFWPAARQAAPSDARPSAAAPIDNGFDIDGKTGLADGNGASLQNGSLVAATASDSAISAPAMTGQAASGDPPAATEGISPAESSDRPPTAKLQRLAALHNPRVASDLALSEQQKLEIGRLLKKVSTEVAHVQARASSETRAARASKLRAILFDAESQAKDILTPEQQARWQSE